MKKRGSKACDIAVFTSSILHLKERADPVLSCLESLIFVLRCESTSITIFVWMICIFICQNITAGFVFAFLSMVLAIVAAFGYVAHLSRNASRTAELDSKRRQTLLFLNYSLNESANYKKLQEEMEKHKIVLSRYKQLIINIQESAVYLCGLIDKVYDIFCWKDTFISLITYFSLFILLLSLLVLPLRWTVSLFITIVFAGCSHMFSSLLKITQSSDETTTARDLGPDTDSSSSIKETNLPKSIIQPSEDTKVTEVDTEKVDKVTCDQQLESPDTREEDRDNEFFEVVGFEDLPTDAAYLSCIKRGNCFSCHISFTALSSWQYCRNCGNDFCSKCCSKKVPRALFGATYS